MSEVRSGEERADTTRGAVVVCLSLLGLSGLSIVLANVPIGGWAALVVLLIAAAQATLIALYYMRLRRSGGLPRLVALVAVFWLAIMLAGTLDDVLTRGWMPMLGR
jgi:caa(3)-type oxidase subunit IV